MSHGGGGAWFPTVDHALGGTADAVTNAGDFVLGGIGSTVSNLFTGAGETVGDTAGGLFGGLFGGLGNWVFQLVALGVGAWLVAQAL